MSKELIERLMSYIPNGDGHNSQYANDLADAVVLLEAKAAPASEREAFESWAKSQGENVKTDGADYYFATTSQLYAGWKAGAAYQFAQQPQSEYGDAYQGAREDLAIWKRRALEAEEKLRVYDSRIVGLGVLAMQSATPQPSAGVVMPEGWKLVPVEPTHEMIDAANSARGWVESDSLSRGCYRAMLAAAPSAPKADDPVKQMLLEALESLILHANPALFSQGQLEQSKRAIAAARQEGGKV